MSARRRPSAQLERDPAHGVQPRRSASPSSHSAIMLPARGGKIIGLTMPVDMKARFSFHAGFVLDVFDGWATIMNAPTEEKLRALSDPKRRARLAEQAAGTAACATWPSGRPVIVETFAPETAAYAGRRVGDIADELGKDRSTPSSTSPSPTSCGRPSRGAPRPRRRRLAGPAPDLERPAGDDRGVRRRRPPRHDRRLPLLHRLPRRSGPPTAAAAARGAIHLLTGAPARLYGLPRRGVAA